MHKQSGAGIPYVALSLCLGPINIKAGYTINAVFELSLYNHLNGTYCGYEGTLLNLFFQAESNYYKVSILWNTPLHLAFATSCPEVT